MGGIRIHPYRTSDLRSRIREAQKLMDPGHCLDPEAVTKKLRRKKSQLKIKVFLNSDSTQHMLFLFQQIGTQCCDVMLQELCRAEQIWLHLEGHAVSGLVLLPSEG
jgi:hypothetical protein